eukprot:scaffold4044_cov399-Prasinococcus_capsulatus_cf.AAC.3
MYTYGASTARVWRSRSPRRSAPYKGPAPHCASPQRPRTAVVAEPPRARARARRTACACMQLASGPVLPRSGPGPRHPALTLQRGRCHPRTDGSRGAVAPLRRDAAHARSWAAGLRCEARRARRRRGRAWPEDEGLAAGLPEGEEWPVALADTSPSWGNDARRTLGVDYGLKKTGLAASAGFAPRPLGVVYEKGSFLLQKIHEVAEREVGRLPRGVLTDTLSGVCSAVCGSELPRRWDALGAEQDASDIVVGIPLLFGDTEGRQATIHRRFAEALALHLHRSSGEGRFRVYLYDERRTTRDARQSLEDSYVLLPAARARGLRHQLFTIWPVCRKANRRRQKRQLDAVAAAILLENYFATHAQQTGGCEALRRRGRSRVREAEARTFGVQPSRVKVPAPRLRHPGPATTRSTSWPSIIGAGAAAGGGGAHSKSSLRFPTGSSSGGARAVVVAMYHRAR